MSCIFGILALAVTWQVALYSSCWGPVLLKEEMQLGCTSWLLVCPCSFHVVHACVCLLQGWSPDEECFKAHPGVVQNAWSPKPSCSLVFNSWQAWAENRKILSSPWQGVAHYSCVAISHWFRRRQSKHRPPAERLSQHLAGPPKAEHTPDIGNHSTSPGSGRIFPKVLPPLGCEVQEILPIFAFQCATEISFADALHTCVWKDPEPALLEHMDGWNLDWPDHEASLQMPQANDATDDIATVLHRTGKQFWNLCVRSERLCFFVSQDSKRNLRLRWLRCVVSWDNDRITALEIRSCGFMTCVVHDMFSWSCSFMAYVFMIMWFHDMCLIHDIWFMTSCMPCVYFMNCCCHGFMTCN